MFSPDFDGHSKTDRAGKTLGMTGIAICMRCSTVSMDRVETQGLHPGMQCSRSTSWSAIAWPSLSTSRT